MKLQKLELDKCLFCLDEIRDKFNNPKYCECKIKLHSECLQQIVSTGLLCPICRIKSSDIINYNIGQQNDDSIISYPFKIFAIRSNILTFTLLVIWCYFVSVFYIIPRLIYLGWYEKKFNNLILMSSLITILILFI